MTPCLFDQLWHARRQAELGTGVWVRRPRRLGAALRRLLADGSLRDAAEALAPAIQAADGTATAADRIEAFLRSM